MNLVYSVLILIYMTTRFYDLPASNSETEYIFISFMNKIEPAFDKGYYEERDEIVGYKNNY
jgi:hypothetical protein